MDSRVRRITSELKKYDPMLYAERDNRGCIHIYRQSFRWDQYSLEDYLLLCQMPQPHLVTSLTDNWSASGKPVEWGLEPLMRKVRMSDLWHDDTQADKLIDQYEKADESKRRKFKNDAEGFFSDNHKHFQRTLGDINTANFKRS